RRDHRCLGDRTSGGIASGGGSVVTRLALPLAEAEPDVLAGTSIDVARRQLARSFGRRGLEAPALDARIIIGPALGLDHTALAAQSSRVLTPDEAGAIAELSARRLAREPVARIVGRKEFWGLPFKVNADTLVPRPETETVVEAALAALDCDSRKSSALHIVDFGTGSGALLLALLSELPRACGIGTDISFAALRCARDNADILGLSARVSFAVCDYGSALAGPADVIVSNPPYVARADIAGLERKYATSTRAARSTVDPTGWTAIARLHPTHGASSRPAASSLSNSDRVSATPRPRSSPPRGLNRSRRNTIFRASLGPWSCGSRMRGPHAGYEKKDLDCDPRPTRFRLGIDPRQ